MHPCEMIRDEGCPHHHAISCQYHSGVDSVGLAPVWNTSCRSLLNAVSGMISESAGLLGFIPGEPMFARPPR